MNASERDPELESLLGGSGDELPDVSALFDGVKAQIDAAEKKPAYRLQTQATPRKRLMSFIAFAMVILVTLLTGRRPDLNAYPPAMLALVLGSLGTLFAISAWSALRPVHKPALTPAKLGLMTAVAVGATLLLALAPGVHDHIELRPDAPLLRHASPCMIYGFIFGLPVYGALRFLDPGSSYGARIVAACAAGLAGNMVLELHCPMGGSTHLMAGHASVIVAYVAGVFVIEAILRARSKSSAES